jgi:putative ABC transport system permease protein
MIVFMQSNIADKYFGPGQPDVYIIEAHPDARQSVAQALEAIARENGLLVQSRVEVHNIVSGIKNGIVGSLWGLLIMGFVVSAFGIANTLAMNVLEQTRELGLMRVVAMTRRQLRRMILAQAIIMGLIGLIPGLGVGIIMAYTTNITTQSVFGHAAAFFLRPWLLVGIFFGACAIVLVAAWVPAVRATRLKLSLALHQE